jgi:hypothetical protein
VRDLFELLQLLEKQNAAHHLAGASQLLGILPGCASHPELFSLLRSIANE